MFCAAEKIAVCIPTYNEAENIRPLLAAVRGRLPAAELLVVDDSSPDGTGAAVLASAAADVRIRLLARARKEGLGKAYLEGFAAALSGGAEAVVQMDADFSHPVERLPELVSALDEADLVIGSRYVPGGGIANWGLHRRLLSRFGSLYAGALLGVGVNDLTGGFKAWRAELLREVVKQPLASAGYAFQVEATYIASRLGARIREVPILFTDRRAGGSKMSLAIGLEAAWKVPALRWRKLR